MICYEGPYDDPRGYCMIRCSHELHRACMVECVLLRPCREQGSYQLGLPFALDRAIYPVIAGNPYDIDIHFQTGTNEATNDQTLIRTPRWGLVGFHIAYYGGGAVGALLSHLQAAADAHLCPPCPPVRNPNTALPPPTARTFLADLRSPVPGFHTVLHRASLVPALKGELAQDLFGRGLCETPGRGFAGLLGICGVFLKFDTSYRAEEKCAQLFLTEGYEDPRSRGLQLCQGFARRKCVPRRWDWY
ncbi:hypothetical protein GE09DRAFT_614294 [Coniochaeta sp. 2T2.1]|nr:hypothetical protein GE09DRAFT_614294 [Coniochaeta sp. 2T2.1]